MKRKVITLISALLLIVMCISFAGCGASEDSDNSTSKSNSSSNTSASSNSDLQNVKDKGTLVVGITDFEPMDYKDDNGKWIGIDADMARAYAKSIGCKVEFIEINWDSKEMELANKNIDCAWNGMTLTDGVKKAMATSNPYCNNAQVVVINTKIHKNVKSIKDCQDFYFTVEAGSAGEEQAQAHGFEYLGVETQSDAVMEVAAGTADACIIDSLMADAMTGNGSSYDKLKKTISLNEEFYGVGFRKGSDLVDSLNDFLKESYQNGKLAKIFGKYDAEGSMVSQ